MAIARFFSTELAGSTVVLRGPQAHHLLNVRRISPTEQIELFDGNGQVVQGQLIKAEKQTAHVQVLTRHSIPRPNAEITLACAMAKGPRWNQLLEKSTELGVTNIWPTIFERSVAGRSHSAQQLDKWNNRCIEAAKQSGQAYLPNISSPRTLKEILQHDSDKSLHLLGTLNESSVPILRALQEANLPKQIVILIGPEGGLTEKEQDLAETNSYQPVFLGTNTLRVETAAICLLAATKAWQDTDPSK